MTGMAKNGRVFACCALAVWGWAGCGGPPMPGGDDAAVSDARPGDAALPDGSTATGCTRDEARIAAAGDCLSDDHCPCGTYCDLGQCVSECAASADCAAGERCDDFGRCRDADHQDLVPVPPATRAPARLEVEPVATIADGRSETLARFVIRDAPARVRVTGRYGAELMCAEGMPFVTECELGTIDADTPVALRARRAPGLDVTDASVIAVYSDGGHASIALVRADQSPFSRLAPPTALVAPEPIAGVYRGFARLDSDGLSPDDVGAPAYVELPITAEIWGDAPGTVTFRVEDPYHVLAGDGVVVGSAVLGASGSDVSGPVTVPVQPYASGALAPSDTWSMLAAWLSAEMHTTTRGGEVEIGTRLELRGTGIRPWLDFNLTLRRTGGPSGAATPATEMPATISYSEPTRLATPTEWEAAIDARFPAYASLTTDGRMARYQFLFDRPALDACSELDLTSGQPDAQRAWYGMSHGGSAGAWRTQRGLVFELLDAADEAGVDYDLGDLTLPYDGVASLGALQGPVCAGVAVAAIEDTVSHLDRIRGTVAFDHCAELAARTGCTVANASVSTNIVRFAITGTMRTTPAGAFAPLSAFMRARLELRGASGGAIRVCTMPSAPTFCPAAASCVEPAAGSTPATVVSASFGSSTLASGDVRCASGARAVGIDLDARADAATVPTRESVEDCITELQRVRAAPALAGTYGDGLRSAFPSATCIDAARLIYAAGLGFDANGGGTAGERSEAYAARLVMRWLDLHANIASEAAERNALLDLVRSVPGAPDVVDPSVALDASLGGWDLLFQPSFGGRLDGLAPNVLADPDYRVGLTGVSVRAGDEQARGLPVAIVDAASRQLRLAHSVLEDRWLEGATPMDRALLAQLLPRVLAARALAAGLASRAGVASGTVAWGSAYTHADATLSADIARAVGLTERALSGANPLGIDDDDLPLYFLDSTTGPGGRFAAVSDFLIGTGPGSTAWVPSLVASTASAESAARSAWIDELDREARAQQSTVEHDRWLADLDAEYNGRLRAFCGTTTANLVADPSFSPLACALDADPSCRDTPGEAYAGWTDDDFLGRMCVANEFAASYLTSRMAHLVDAQGRPTHPSERRLAPNPPYGRSLQFFAVDCYRGAATRVHRGSCPEGSGECLFCDSGVLDPGLPDASDHIPLNLATMSFLGRLDAEHFAQLQTCQGVFPEMRETVPMRESRFSVPGCAHGAIGDAFAGVAQADDDLELARAEAAEHMESYDIAMRSCLILEEANTQIMQANDAHVANMTTLVRRRADMESAAAVLGRTADCLSELADATVGVFEAPGVGTTIAAGLSVASCGAGEAAGGLEASAAQVQGDIEIAEVAHDALVDNLAAAAETDICFNDARLELVGMRASTLRIQAAAVARSRAVERLTQLVLEVQRVHDEGADYIAEVTDARVTPPAGELWASSTIRTFSERFRLARRASYLAVRAVEHEFQASLMARQEVLAADTSEDLEAVLRTLWTTAGTRSIGGSRPSDLHVVLSLRDDILRLADESSVPAGLQALSPTERLHIVLSDERYAVRDASGRMTGLQIPFTLAPLGALGLPTGGVPIYGTTDCAERVWSVNASILGTDVWVGSDTTYARIDLLKQNTFFSQWCGTAPPGQPFQLASVRPSTNLFLEPGISETVTGPFGTGETELYSRARIQAFFGVSRAELEDPRYVNGETSELAARGLYGEYALFVPAELIGRETAGGGHSDGLILDHVDDILLRLDYVSVAR